MSKGNKYRLSYYHDLDNYKFSFFFSFFHRIYISKYYYIGERRESYEKENEKTEYCC